MPWLSTRAIRSEHSTSSLMFATITALVISTAGLGFGAAGCVMAGRTAKRGRALEAATSQQIGLVLQAMSNQVQHIDALMASQEGKVQMSAAMLSERLRGLETIALEELITREEVSAAFAELAAIEQQRTRQAAMQQSLSVAPVINPSGTQVSQPGANGFPVTAMPGARAGLDDPWSNAKPPADPAQLLSEIAAMNERLRQRIQNAGTALPSQSVGAG